MGRKKITIKPIDHSSTRRATFEKRRIGLLKKAMELSILCKSAVSLTIYTDEGEVFIYSSEPYENIIQKFQNYSGSYRLLTNDHLNELIPGKSVSSDVGYNVVKQPTSNAVSKPPMIHHPQHNPIINNFNANPSIIMPRIDSNTNNNNNNYKYQKRTSNFTSYNNNVVIPPSNNVPIQLQTRVRRMPIPSLPTKAAHNSNTTIPNLSSFFTPNMYNQHTNQSSADMNMSTDNNISNSDDTFMVSNSNTSSISSDCSVSQTQYKYIGKRRSYSEISNSNDIEFDTVNNNHMKYENDTMLLEPPEPDIYWLENQRKQQQYTNNFC